MPPVVALPPGFIGTYHPATGIVNDTQNTSAYDVGNWGLVAIENKPNGGDPTVSFKSQIDFHCNKHEVNQIFGMIIAFTEGGIYSNPNDTDVYNPLWPAAMLQGAARWSKNRSIVSSHRRHCDRRLLGNYAPPSPPGPCAQCPSKSPHPYGSLSAGVYCCPWPVWHKRRCIKPPSAAAASSPECCLFPGFSALCQGRPRCGVNQATAHRVVFTRPLSTPPA